MRKRLRFDRSRLDNVERTPQGFVRAPAFVTRVGILKYTLPDGKVVKEFRPPEEVFKADSMSTLAGIPFTNDHPRTLIDADNAQSVMVGFTGDRVDKVDDTFLRATVTVTDSKTIKDIESGKLEVSCGYEAELDETPGTWQGEHYDCIQRNIIYNHVSLVGRGRAGRDVRLRLDSEGNETPEDALMEKITINGVDYEVTPEVAKAFKAYAEKMQTEMTQLKTQYDEAKPKAEQVPALEQKVSEAVAKADGLQAKVDSLTDDLKKRTDSSIDDKIIQERVQERIKLERVALAVLPAETKLDGMTNVDVMKAVVKARSDKADLDGKSDAYIQARFDHVAESIDESRIAAASFGRNRFDNLGADQIDLKARRDAMIKESQSAWKKPTSAVKN